MLNLAQHPGRASHLLAVGNEEGMLSLFDCSEGALASIPAGHATMAPKVSHAAHTSAVMDMAWTQVCEGGPGMDVNFGIWVGVVAACLVRAAYVGASAGVYVALLLVALGVRADKGCCPSLM